MAFVQIPNLPAVIGLAGDELFEGVQAGTSVKISLNQIIAATRAGLPTTLPIPVILGGTGVSTLTGYVKGSGTDPFTASITIPNTDITGLGTMATQNANAVAITGGSVTGITDITVSDGGTGVSTLTGYVKGSGTSPFTASITIPSGDITGLGTMSVQNANAVAITGGTITGITDLAVADGGTGQGAALTQYGVIYGSTATEMAATAAGTATQVLHGNASGAPTFGAVSLTADVSGTLPAANGGTGVTTAPAEAARILGYTSTATAAGTTVLTNTSTQYQLFTGVTTQTITLPVTSTLGTGWSFHIVNNSTGSLTVNSSGGNLVAIIIAGLSAMVTCIGTTLTTAADWEPGFTDFQSLTGTGAVVLADGATMTNGVFNGTVGATTPATGIFTTVSDAAGNVRNIVNNAQASVYILVVGDNGKMINITTGGVTVNSGIFSAGQNITIYNNSAASQTVTQGAGVTLRLAGSATTGNRTLALRGICTIVCVASNEFVVSGAGLS
jgi:hypothetical protein